MKNIIAKGITGAGLVASLALGGCGTEMGEDDIEVQTGAFNIDQCATAAPAATFTGAYSWSSPAGYNKACNAVDETTGGKGGGYYPYGSKIVESSMPTTKAECEAVSIRTVFYRTYMGGWVPQKDETNTGVWGLLPSLRIGCKLKGTSFPVPEVGGVRVATTVRRPSGSSFVTYPFKTTFARQ